MISVVGGLEDKRKKHSLSRGYFLPNFGMRQERQLVVRGAIISPKRGEKTELGTKWEVTFVVDQSKVHPPQATHNASLPYHTLSSGNKVDGSERDLDFWEPWKTHLPL